LLVFKKEGDKHKKFKLMSYLLSFVVVLISMLFTMFDIKLNLLIGIEGAVSGFFIVYNVPTLLHWQCLKSKMRHDKLNEENNENKKMSGEII